MAGHHHTTVRSRDSIGRNYRAISQPAVVAAVFVLLASTLLRADELPPLTLERLFETPALFGVVPSMPAWSPDSRYLAFTWNDAGMPQRGLWVVSNDGSALRRLDGGPEVSPSVFDLAWLPAGNTIISLRGTGLWMTSLDTGRDTLLVDVGEGAYELRIAPDGKRATYLRNGDLWFIDLDDLDPTAMTDVGVAPLSSLKVGRYNRPEREIGPGIWGGPTYAWSPDGRFIAVHHVDRRQVRRVPFPDYLAAETDPNEVRRGYPGDANERRSVGLLDVETGSLQLLELVDPAANQVVGFDWSPDGVLLVDVASDTAVERRLYTARPGEDPREIWHDRRESRIYTSFASAWHPDGKQVVFLSDLDDRYGLYAIDATARDADPERVTDPDSDVLGAPDVVAATNEIFFAANAGSPYERQVFKVSSDGGTTTRVTTLAGQNQAYPSPDGKALAIIHSNDQAPPELYVTQVETGETRRVTSSPAPEFFEREWARARYVSFPSHLDDYVLHARILEPANLEPGRKYPVLFGPIYSNTVRNRWAGIYTAVQQLLVQKGYIVVQVDLRGSTGYGRAFREEFLTDFAGDDIEDVVSAVHHISKLDYVDPERFGIWGSSYGGTMSLYTLLKKPGLFRAGVAAATAVDPHFFGTDDVAIVRRPETHPEIFENKAANYADNLEDHLLLIHGMQDQVVPFKTVAEVADVLIRNDKEFETAFVPGATHSWRRESLYAPYLFGRMIEFFDRYLVPGSTTLHTQL